MPDREVILVRTHYFDDELAAFVTRLEQSGRQVCLYLDELAGPIAVPERFTRLSLTQADVARHGLRETNATGWQCGDYGLYAAVEKFPHATHFWVVEPDLLINAADLRAFFARFARHPEVDLIACYLRPATTRWFWHGPSLPHFSAVWRCIYPIVRVSRPAVAAMHEARGRISAALAGTDLIAEPWRWPNDEALTASACASAGLVCRDLNDFGTKVYDGHTFSFDCPHSQARLTSTGADDRVYHPVLSGRRFVTKMERQIAIIEGAPALDLVSRFDRRVLADFKAECGPEVAALFAARFRAMGRRISPVTPVRESKILLYRLRHWLRATLHRPT